MKERLQAWGDAKVIAIASCLVFDKDGRVLLLQRHSEDLGGGKWGTPGGRLEADEAAESAAIRELLEETGIVAPAQRYLGKHAIRMPHGAVRMYSYQVTVPNGVSICLDPEEHQDYAWFYPGSIVETEQILWGVPTILRDFGYVKGTVIDPTLHDGSTVTLLELGSK